MKIDLQSNFNLFHKKVDEGAAPYKSAGASELCKTDQAAFSRGATSLPDRQMLTLKASIQNFATAPASSERLSALRESIKNGTYHISSYELADAILNLD